MSVDSLVQSLLANSLFKEILSDHRLIPAKEAQYAENHLPWPKPLKDLLAKRNLKLYTHQALATDHLRCGHSLMVSTPTASGKSLIYNLPVLEQYLLDRESHALYLFPLKALAQDQLQNFQSLTCDWPESARPRAALYDGDTKESLRRQIREDPPAVLITNPEMLHLGILPWHDRWTKFLAGLRLIIVDEAHTYRGVFGSNVAHLFRRLNRIQARYGLRSVYALSSATIGNPLELATQLIDAPKEATPIVIEESGAPQGPRHFFFLNPLNSPSTTAIYLLREALKLNLRTIVYCQSRKMTELISVWASSAEGSKYKDFISAYRAGFLPEERREIEAKMANGQLKGVVTTSALELGIDIGGLDVCILVGYPGSIMSTLQRGGRVGRAGQESAVFIIACEDALDQYFAHNPEDFFQRAPEKAVLNPFNPIILARHLECAAKELPLYRDETYLQNEAAKKALQSLEQKGLLKLSLDQNYYLSTRKDPWRNLALRGAGSSCHIEDPKGQIIGSLDLFRVCKDAHPGAVYLHRGETYVIQSLDLDLRQVVAEKAEVKWHTKPRGQKFTTILEEEERQSLGRCLVARGRLRITEQITAYEKRSNFGNQLLAVINLNLPPQIFETEGLWYIIPDALRLNLEKEFFHFMGSIHALEHAIIGLLPLQVLADRNDFGGISNPLHLQVGLPTIFIYDGIPGGAGLTREAFKNAKQILEDTYQAILTCPCKDGCPSCVHSPKCASGNRPISKSGALRLLEELLGEGNEGYELYENLNFEPLELLCESTSDFTFLNPASPPLIPPKELAQITSEALKKVSHPEIPASSLKIENYTLKSPPPYYLAFDVETRLSAREVGGWGQASKMGVSVTVAYDSRKDCFLHFEQKDLPDLFDRFKECDLIIGFNHLRFDFKVLQPFTEMDLYKLPSLDLLQVITKETHVKISLDSLAKATLKAQKTAHGLQALKWWKEGKIAEIATYCEQDVQLTKDLYLYGLEHGYLFYTNKYEQKVQVKVDFST